MNFLCTVRKDLDDMIIVNLFAGDTFNGGTLRLTLDEWKAFHGMLILGCLDKEHNVVVKGADSA